MDANDNSIINQVINDLGLSGYTDISTLKLLVDFDEDGISDSIYSVIFDNEFSILFIYNNGNIDVIEKNVGNGDDRLYMADRIVDIRNNGSIELIYTGFFPNGSSSDTCPIIYDIVNKKVVHNFCE